MNITCLRHATQPPKLPLIQIISAKVPESGGVIKVHLAADKMLEKSIKDHPIVIVVYYQWLVSNSEIKKAMDAKIMAAKLKEKVEELSSLSDSSSKRINELKIYVASAKKSADTDISKLGSFSKK